MEETKMISEFNQQHCLGCGACCSICPKECLEIKKNKKGFFSAYIHSEKCIECHLCENVCPINKDEKSIWNPLKIYYGKYKDNNVVMKSSSGGAFTAFAEEIIKQGGMVYGVEFDITNKMAKYVAVKDCGELFRICKSKYVQANIEKVFKDVQENLKQGQKVVFSGTPCAVHGLHTFLKSEYENLYTIDFVCHGAPSPKVLNDYLVSLEKKYGSKILRIDFRPKTYGWAKHSLKIEFENGKIQDKRMMLDPFFKAFMSDNMILNDPCYECSYITRHISDITLADFWGYKLVEDYYDEEGISLIFCNSVRGMQLFENINKLSVKEVSKDKLSYIFDKKAYSKEYYERQKKFFLNYDEYNVEKCIEKHTKTSKYVVMLKLIWNLMRKKR